MRRLARVLLLWLAMVLIWGCVVQPQGAPPTPPVSRTCIPMVIARDSIYVAAHRQPCTGIPELPTDTTLYWSVPNQPGCTGRMILDLETRQLRGQWIDCAPVMPRAE